MTQVMVIGVEGQTGQEEIVVVEGEEGVGVALLMFENMVENVSLLRVV